MRNTLNLIHDLAERGVRAQPRRPDPPSNLSPYGDRVLTRDLDVVSIADGAVTALPALAGFQDRDESAGWEDNGHILVAVRASGDHVQPVRCDVVAATCERAGEPLSTVNDYIDFSSYAGEK